MPTNYTGNATAAESPSPAPGPGGVPIVALPADSDPPNAATFAQAYKILANFIAWLTTPFAIINAWTQNIVIWYNALLQPISGIDHFGMRRGRLYPWTENWSDGHSYDIGGGPSQRTDGRKVAPSAYYLRKPDRLRRRRTNGESIRAIRGTQAHH